MKPAVFFFVLLIAIPFVAAEEEDCGLTNLASCIPQKFFDFLLSLASAPIEPFLSLIQSLLVEPAEIRLFGSIWAIIIYIISLFYGLFIVLAGFQFVISGYDAVKRQKAKEMLKNVVLMVFLVQASFFLYEMALDVSSMLTSGIFSMIDHSFFTLSADNLSSLGLELFLVLPYLLVLLITVLLLTLRYLFVAVGVVLFPIGLFFSFVGPLNSYGKLIINILLLLVFLPFFQSIILLAASKLIELEFFSNFKIVVMISSFLLIDLIMIVTAFFAAGKAVSTVSGSDIGRTVASGIKLVA